MSPFPDEILVTFPQKIYDICTQDGGIRNGPHKVFARMTLNVGQKRPELEWSKLAAKRVRHLKITGY